jgi:hypothetical protein
MPESEIEKQLRGIFDLWNDTEARIKEAERLRAEVVIPSIKELRYAGRWLADVLGVIFPLVEDKLSPEQRSTLERYLFETTQNCVRAKNDAIDASVLFVHRRLEQMVNAFGIPNVFSYFPDYVRMLTAIREVDAIITDTRGAERPNRNELYDKIASEHLPGIIKVYNDMMAAEDAIQASIAQAQEEQDARERRNWYRSIIGYGIGATGIIIGIIIKVFS